MSIADDANRRIDWLSLANVASRRLCCGGRIVMLMLLIMEVAHHRRLETSCD